MMPTFSTLLCSWNSSKPSSIPPTCQLSSRRDSLHTKENTDAGVKNAGICVLLTVVNCCLLARPFAPAIAITHKDGVCRLNIRPCIVRRTGRLRCTAPGAWIENLENTLGMAPTNQDGIVRIWIQARFTLRDTQCLRGIGPENLGNHRRNGTRRLADCPLP